MKQLLSASSFLLLFVSGLASSEPKLLFSEGFESGGANAKVQDGGSIVTNSPSAGSYAARVNLFEGDTDPLVQYPDNRSTVITTNSSLTETYPDILYLTYDFRFDDSLWRNDDNVAYSWGDGTSQDIAVSTKGGYYGKYNNIVTQGFYLVWRGGNSGEILFGDNSNGDEIWDSSWESSDWSPGGSLLYLSTGQPFGANGKWNKFEMELDTSGSLPYVRAKIWVNGFPATSSKYAPDSDDNYFKLPRGFVIEQFSTSYASPQDLAYSRDRLGEAGGLQIDNIQVWAGNPVTNRGGEVSGSEPSPPSDVNLE